MKKTNNTQNYYELLQVDRNASPEVIQAAYRARAKQVHPDKGGNKTLFNQVNTAKSVLLDSDKKEQYDSGLVKRLGNYEVVREIAEGGFGRTYEARHIHLKEKACLKQSLYLSEEDNELLESEAKLLWDIHHHSLPTLKDYFYDDGGTAVLAMSFIEGPTLDKLVDKYKRIDPEAVCWINQRLLNALHYLHFNGIVHCDVKPNNIIVQHKKHNAVLVDYGFASIKPKSDTKPTGYTEVFAAPELIAVKPPLPQTDLYSLGLTAIYAFGGNPITKVYPDNVPGQIQDYFNQFLDDHPLKRPSWDDKDLIKELSDIRFKVFGRRSSNKELKIK